MSMAADDADVSEDLPYQLRLRNDTELSFDSVTVETNLEYGSLPAGALSEYLPIAFLYDTLYVVAESAGSRVIYAPIDHLGDPMLAPGYYTYVLTLHRKPGWFRITVQSDAAPD